MPRPRDSHRLRIIKTPHRSMDELEAVEEPIVESITLEPPEWLHPYAKEEWCRVALELSQKTWLGGLDAMLFARYCQMFARWRQCEDKLEEGELVEVGGDPAKGQEWLRPNPYAKLAIQFGSEMERGAARFGITPGARKGWTQPKAEKTGLQLLRESAKGS